MPSCETSRVEIAVLYYKGPTRVLVGRYVVTDAEGNCRESFGAEPSNFLVPPNQQSGAIIKLKPAASDVGKRLYGVGFDFYRANGEFGFVGERRKIEPCAN